MGRCGVAATFFCPCWGTVKATVSPLKFQWGGSRPLVAHPLRDPPGCTRHRVPLCNPFVSPSGRLQALLCERVGGECVCVIDCPVGCWLGMGTPCNCTDPPGFGTLHGDLLSAVGYPPPPPQHLYLLFVSCVHGWVCACLGVWVCATTSCPTHVRWGVSENCPRNRFCTFLGLRLLVEGGVFLAAMPRGVTTHSLALSVLCVCSCWF